MNNPKPKTLEERFLALARHGQWNAVQEVSSRLRQNGFQALLAGGCVRDLLLGREPNDFDIATDATPDQVHAIYPHALTVGKAFGVTILPCEGFQIEIATFREDLDYRDGRRPSGVRFSGPEQDAKRRDFTINALFYDPIAKKILDFVDGEKDLARRLIRTVGTPEERFEEDKLRLLRAVRFAAQLDFEISPETLAAISRMASQVSSVSRERVRDELTKLFKAARRRRGLELALSTGLLAALFPNLPIGPEQERWLRRLDLLEPQAPSAVGFALFFLPGYRAGEEQKFKHDFLKPLKLDNRQIEAIAFALRHAGDFLKPESLRRGELLLLLANPLSEAARSLARVLEREADPSAKISARDQTLNELAEREFGAERLKPEPLIGGDDAKSLGLRPGSRMGALLKEAYLLQLEGRLRSRDEALKWLKDQIEN